MKKWLIFLPVLFLLAACSAVDLSAPDVEPALTAVIQPQATDTAKPTAEPTPEATETAEPALAQAVIVEVEPAKSDAADTAGDAVIIFHRTGGFAGLDQQWMIYADGRIELPDGSQKQVDAAQIQLLLDTVQAANFFDLNDSYVPVGACCDQFNYSITVQLGDQSKTINTIDNAPKQPEQLTAVLDSINELLSTLP